MHRQWVFASSLLLALTLASCGGGAGTSAGNNGGSTGGGSSNDGGGGTSGGGTSGGGSSNPNGQLTTPTTVTVAAGQTTSGVDITVPNTASSLNVKLLGVNAPNSSTGSASNSGGRLARGTTGWVLAFGDGLSSSVKATVSGPKDVTVSNIQAISATDNTPGISFNVVASSGATPGVRSVVFTDAQNNVSVFTGGLEIY